MKLHANAALCLNQRRRLAKRVNEEGWSAARAAGTNEVSRPSRSPLGPSPAATARAVSGDIRSHDIAHAVSSDVG